MDLCDTFHLTRHYGQYSLVRRCIRCWREHNNVDQRIETRTAWMRVRPVFAEFLFFEVDGVFRAFDLSWTDIVFGQFFDLTVVGFRTRQLNIGLAYSDDMHVDGQLIDILEGALYNFLFKLEH